MAGKWDNTPPQNLIILATALGSAMLLFSLKFGFDAYYDGMRDQAVERVQTGEYDDLTRVNERHAEWDRQLASGNRMSIEAAMSQLASRGRNADPAIRPQAPAEMNTGPLEGWNQLPQEVVIPETPPAGAAANVAPQGNMPTLSPEALQQLLQALQGRAPGQPAPVFPTPAPEGGH